MWRTLADHLQDGENIIHGGNSLISFISKSTIDTIFLYTEKPFADVLLFYKLVILTYNCSRHTLSAFYIVE